MLNGLPAHPVYLPPGNSHISFHTARISSLRSQGNFQVRSAPRPCHTAWACPARCGIPCVSFGKDPVLLYKNNFLLPEVHPQGGTGAACVSPSVSGRVPGNVSSPAGNAWNMSIRTPRRVSFHLPCDSEGSWLSGSDTGTAVRSAFPIPASGLGILPDSVSDWTKHLHLISWRSVQPDLTAIWTALPDPILDQVQRSGYQ